MLSLFSITAFKIFKLLRQHRSKRMTIQQHCVDDMGEVEPLLVLQTLIVLGVGIGLLERVASGSEVMRDDALLYDVGDVIHIIDTDIALVLGIDPVELFKRMNDDGIVCGVITRKTTVGVLNEDRAVNVLLADGLVYGLGLRGSGLVEDYYLGIGDAIDTELECETFGERILLIEVTEDGDVYMVEAAEVQTLEGADAMHDSVFGDEEYARKTGGIFRFVGSDGHDERPLRGRRI